MLSPTDLWFNWLFKNIRNRLDIVLRRVLQEIYRCSNGAVGKLFKKNKFPWTSKPDKWWKNLSGMATDDILITKHICKQVLGEMSSWLIVQRKSDWPKNKKQIQKSLCPVVSTLHPTKSEWKSQCFYLVAKPRWKLTAALPSCPTLY